ncbi:endopeptidase La [bacterium]|jgi:ATP-dependent Lon protease|nr:endopeptidase La [bacterium]
MADSKRKTDKSKLKEIEENVDSDESSDLLPEEISSVRSLEGGETEEKERKKRDEVFEIPVLPLREIVVFPYMVIPLFVGRSLSLKAIEKAMEGNREILLVSQKQAKTDNPEVTDLHDVGTIAEIMQLLKLPDGIVKILVEGTSRASIESFVETSEYYCAKIREYEDLEEKNLRTQALMRNVIAQFEQYIKLNKNVPIEIINVTNSVESPGRLADIIVAHLKLKVETKQKVLAAFSAEERLSMICDILNREIEILNIEKKIRGRVRKQMEQVQKEYYLREQIKAIQKELGENDEVAAEVKEFREQIEKAKMPKEVKDKALKELDKFSKMSYSSAESGVIRNYLEVLVELPWSKKSKDKLDAKRAQEILDKDHYGLIKVKERITEFVAVAQLKKSLKGPILCMVGPPGVGKTSLAKSVAEALGRKFVRVSLGGMRDEAEIRGHRRTYVGAMPGRIIQMLKQAGTKNPVILLDEIDKTGADFKGDPASALLEVLDPEQNVKFRDHYIGVPFDLSQVLFLTTANQVRGIPGPLLDRMELITLAGYTEEEKLEIGMRYLVPKQLEENGIKEDQIEFERQALAEVIRCYTREAGVRELERKIGSICRKIARDIVTSKQFKSRKVSKAQIPRYLGARKYLPDMAEEEDQVGVVTGLAVTSLGGCTLPIEVEVLQGSGKIQITGNLGDVMKESCHAAVTYVRKHRDEFGISKDFHKKVDIHIHAPEAATPKDGPSAGITIATAVVSALADIRVKKDVAMTGEISLKGKVLPIGGVKEKSLAAYRVGIRDIILCRDNEKDLEDIPKEILKKIKFHIVDEISEVLEVAFVPGDLKKARSKGAKLRSKPRKVKAES